MSADPSGRDKSRADRAQWGIGLVSALIVALMLGLLLFHAWRGTDGLPQLEITQNPAESTSDQLRFVVVNKGARTASDVTIALTFPGGPETRRITIDFVPAYSQVTGAFLLDPAAGALPRSLGVESYLDP